MCSCAELAEHALTHSYRELSRVMAAGVVREIGRDTRPRYAHRDCQQSNIRKTINPRLVSKSPNKAGDVTTTSKLNRISGNGCVGSPSAMLPQLGCFAGWLIHITGGPKTRFSPRGNTVNQLASSAVILQLTTGTEMAGRRSCGVA